MRSTLRAIGRAIRRALASVAWVAMIPVRPVDGTLSWVWQTVAGGGASGYVADEIESVVDEARDEPEALSPDDRYSQLGLAVKAIAEALVAGQTVPASDMSAYVSGLRPSEIAAIIAADPVAVGRHMLGGGRLETAHGVALPAPDPAEDRRRMLVRSVAEKSRREQLAADDRKAKREREAVYAPSLVPSF